MFDVTKARKIAESFMEYLEAEDKEFLRVGMTIRGACNEIESLRTESAAMAKVVEAARVVIDEAHEQTPGYCPLKDALDALAPGGKPGDGFDDQCG